jgi:hypothetical protein
MADSQDNSYEPTDEEIALTAYRLWLQDGSPHGRDKENWLAARNQLIAEKAKEVKEAAEQGQAA